LEDAGGANADISSKLGSGCIRGICISATWVFIARKYAGGSYHRLDIVWSMQARSVDEVRSWWTYMYVMKRNRDKEEAAEQEEAAREGRSRNMMEKRRPSSKRASETR